MTMHATDFYTSTCRCVMQSNPEDPETLVELRRLLPSLRQSLGCYVCFNLLKDPMGPSHNVCRHSVCRNCLGGKMRLKPACSWCKDHWDFVANPLLKILVTCFKKLCIYIYNSQLGSVIQNNCVNGETNHLMQLLREGMDFNDDYEPPVSQLPGELPALTNVQSTSSFESHTEQSTAVEDPEKDPIVKDESEKNAETPECTLLTEAESTSFTSTSAAISRMNLKHPRKFQKYGKKRKTQRKVHDHNYESQDDKESFSKPVVLVKRKTAGRKLNQSKKAVMKTIPRHARKKKQKGGQVKKFNLRNSGGEAPSDLERMDGSSLSSKKCKTDLLPPELKPLSSCNCGKSGNFNQLTCIGQRCPCYSMKLPCVSCKCRGCRNPKKGPDYQHIFNINSASVLRSGTRSTTES